MRSKKLNNPISQYTEVLFPVLYGVSNMRNKEASKARPGDTVTVCCKTNRSNPPSTIKWILNTAVATKSAFTVMAAPQSSWIIRSNVFVVIPCGQPAALVTCETFGNVVYERVSATQTIKVLHLPGAS